MAGRVALDRRIQQVSDVLSDPGYGRRDMQELGGYRTLIGAPLILDDEVVGAISLWRTKVEPFDDRATAMLEAFAAQAAAVVRNVHLVRALEARQARAGPQGRTAAGAQRGRGDGELDASSSTTCCSRSS